MNDRAEGTASDEATTTAPAGEAGVMSVPRPVPPTGLTANPVATPPAPPLDALEVDVDVEGNGEVDDDDLLPRVRELLTRVGSASERTRFESFFRLAASAIERLGDLDVEGTAANDETGDAILWETLAPAARFTLTHVDAFLEHVRRDFPAAITDSDVDLDRELFEAAAEAPVAAPDSDRGINSVLSAFCSNLSRELASLRRHLAAGDEAPADRGHLLEQLAEFRGRARSGIGEMVFAAARLFAMVRKEDVVPFYKEDLESSLRLRQAMAKLRATIELRRARLERAAAARDAAATRAALQRIVLELEAFTGTPGFKLMRSADRRSFFRVRRELTELAQSPSDGPINGTLELEGLSKFLDSLTLMNRRELLLVHDRENLADTIRYLESTRTALMLDDLEARRAAFGRALTAAERLAGRDVRLDAARTMARTLDVTRLDTTEALGLVQLLRGLCD